MHFGILGPLEVDGAPFAGSPKQQTLLLALLLSRGRPVPDERLIEALWPRRPPASAAHALQVYVSELRKAGIDIVRDGGAYRLDARLDADEFERFVVAGREETEARSYEAALEKLDEALALWRGSSLAGLEDDAFAAAEIGRLDELRIAAVEDRVESMLALGRTPDLQALENLVAEHPLRERLRGLLMLALYRCGRQADALEAYADGRRALDELGLEPGAELRALQASILRQDAALAVEPESLRARRHLPSPTTALVGRRAEVGAVTELLRGDTRLVTLTGPGGAGKTRVGLQAASELADAFGDGVWFVGLAALVDPALVRPTIATALGLPEKSLLEELRARDLLLLLDNFEQVLEAAPLVSELLQAAPRLRVLTTSRAPLRLYGEHELPVPPLPAGEAEELFAARAHAAGRDLTDRRLVTEICERLDRLPLAIELVAARTKELMADELVASLDRRLELASRGARDLPERQRTLRAAIAWSDALLEPAGRRLLARLAVFAGGFEREAAASVCSEDVGELEALLEGSLIRRGDDGRCRMLQTIREYALERLAAEPDADEVRSRHADHYLELAERNAAAFVSEGAESALAAVAKEHDNLRAALDFALTGARAELSYRLAGALSRFWLVRGHISEGRAWLERVLLEHDVPSLLRAGALNGLATLEWRQGELLASEAHAREALELATAAGSEDERFRSLVLLGNIAQDTGERDRALVLREQGVELARSLGNDAHLSLALNNLGALLWEDRDWVAVAEIFDECLAAARRSGSSDRLAFALLGLGDVNLRLGNMQTGRAQLAEALSLFSGLGFHHLAASCCVWLAWAPLEEGDHVAAARLLGAASGLRGATAVPDRVEQEFIDETVARLRQALGDASFEASVASGVEDAEEIVRHLLAGELSGSGSPS